MSEQPADLAAAVHELVEDLRASVFDLPIDRQEDAFAQMGAALLTTERTGDPAPVIRYVESLRLTSRLHRNRAYRKAVTEADAELHEEMTSAVDVGHFVDEMRVRHA